MQGGMRIIPDDRKCVTTHPAQQIATQCYCFDFDWNRKHGTNP